MSTTAQAVWVCSGCEGQRTKPEKRLPAAWKRHQERIYCDVCWRKSHILRAVTVPIAKPVDEDWADLRRDLGAMWSATTQVSNWMMTELYVRDVRRDGEKLAPMPQIYLYPEARERFSGLPSQSVASLENTIKKKYRTIRYKVIWTAQMSLPSYRYEVPFPVPNQGWSLSTEQQRYIVSVRIGDKRHRLQLRTGGGKFRRQKAALDQILSGDAEPGELALYRRDKDILCKMVAWLPRIEREHRGERSGVLMVRSDAHSLIVALNEKDETLWTYHADHLVRWVVEHKRRLQHWADDSKSEDRPVPSFAERRRLAAERYQRRMSSSCHEIAMRIAGYAHRRRFRAVRYNDSDRSFCPEFPWQRLTDLLVEKLDAFGIEYASGRVEQETPGPLGNGEADENKG